MDNAKRTLEALLTDLNKTFGGMSFPQKLETLANFVDSDLDDVIQEIQEGIDRIEELENELSEAKEEIERLERELDEAV